MNQALVKDDTLRQEALELYGLVEAAPDSVVDDLVRLAAQLCGVPMAGVALVGAESLFLHARTGPGPSRLSRGNTPVEQTSLGDTVYEVPDARRHPDFAPDGIMIAGRSFRFFAGAPLTTPAGVSLGCLFVQDSVPHTLTDKQKSALLTLSRQVITRLELNSRVRQMELAARLHQRTDTALTVERNFVSAVLDTVGALVAVAQRQFDDVAHVDVVAELDALDHATIAHVQARDDAPAQHANASSSVSRPSSSDLPSTAPAQPTSRAARTSAASRMPPEACTSTPGAIWRR